MSLNYDYVIVDARQQLLWACTIDVTPKAHEVHYALGLPANRAHGAYIYSCALLSMCRLDY